MNPSLFVVIPTATFVTIQAADGLLGSGGLIHNSVSFGLNTYYITDNLTPPAGQLYIARLNSDGSMLVAQAKSALLTPLQTFLGWAIPA